MTILRTLMIVILVQSVVERAQPSSSIQGTIRKADGTGAISGATVELRRVDGSVDQLFSVLTSGDGTFRFVTVTPGEYRLLAKLPGYIPWEYGQRRWSGSGVAFTLAAGQSMDAVEIPMTQAGSVSGRITDRDGDAMVGGTVQAMTSSYWEDQRVLQIVQTTFTNDLGEYQLFGLQPGRYYLSASPGGFLRYAQPAYLNVPGPAGLVPGAALSLGGTNLPASASPVYYPGTPDQRSASAIDVSAGADIGGNNFSVFPVPKVHVRGSLGVNGARIRIVALNPAPGSSAVSREIVASNGSFDVADVSPGEHLVIAQAEGMEGKLRVVVSGTDINNANVELRAGVSVATRIRIDGRAPSENDLAFRSMKFNLTPDPAIPGIPGPTYSTFSDGSLSLRLTPGFGYRIALVLAADTPVEFQNAYIQSIQLGTQDVLNSRLQIDAEPEAKLEVVIGMKAGTMTGTAIDNRQRPAIHTTVVMVPDAARRGRSDAFRTATTDSSGRFRIDRIPPGEYKVFAWDDVQDGAWQNPEFLRLYEDRGITLRIMESGRESLSLSVIK